MSILENIIIGVGMVALSILSVGVMLLGIEAIKKANDRAMTGITARIVDIINRHKNGER